MAKKEFNKKSVRDEVRELLGLPPAPPMTAKERKAADHILRNLRDAHRKDPDFDKKMMEAWVEAEVATDPDAFESLSPLDVKEMLKDAVAPKARGTKARRQKNNKGRNF